MLTKLAQILVIRVILVQTQHFQLSHLPAEVEHNQLFKQQEVLAVVVGLTKVIQVVQVILHQLVRLKEMLAAIHQDRNLT